MLYFKPEVYLKDKIDNLINSEMYVNLKSACEEVYPERYELKINLPKQVGKFYTYFQTLKEIQSLSFSLTIHFPEVVVTNRDLMKHTIKDLYFVIEFIFSDVWKLFFKGKRSTYSINELNSNYIHSHLGNRNLNSLEHWVDDNFWCLGASELLNYQTLQNTSKESLQMLLLLIPNYVSYESIEGRPYRYLKNIGISKTGLPKISDYILNKLYERYKNKFTIKLNNNLEIINLEEFEDSIELKEDNNDYFAYKVNNVYYPVNQELNNMNYLHNKFLFNFNDKPIYSKVENKITEIKSKKYAHPAITRYFAKRINKQIKDLYCRKHGENSKSNNSIKSEESNLVLM